MNQESDVKIYVNVINSTNNMATSSTEITGKTNNDADKINDPIKQVILDSLIQLISHSERYNTI